MDPSSISPPPASAPAPLQAPALNTVPFAVEPNNHPPAAASAPPAAHPPYAEMIYTAIEALKEKNGSSKRAIAKYIEQVYKEQLPPTHDTLLSHHLKRLKNNGMLVMFKKSYKLPRSVPGDADASASAQALAPAPAPAPAASTTPGSRPRGRPRKTQPQPNVQAQNVPLQPFPAGDVNNAQQQNAEPVWAALGLADEPMPAQAAATDSNKRRPGRPRKSVAPGLGQPGPFVATPARRGRPPGSRSQKRPGRPKANPAAAVAVSGGPKRRPGRPPKNQQQQATPIPFAVIPATAAAAPEAPAEQPGGGAVAAVGTPGRRGRPRKNAAVAAAVAAANVAVGGGRGRGRGRGRGGGGRGRGRGRGGLAVQPKNPTGRRPGRPKKGTTSAAVSQNAAANEDLKRKLEHFQSKVKESLAVLKPHFNHESPVTAIAAIQELEVLGTMDLNAPFRDETLPQQQQLPPQEPPPAPQQQQQPPQQQLLPQQQQQLLQQHLPPQQLPQPQVYQQQFPQFHLQQYHQQQQMQFHQQQQPQLFQHQASPPHHQQHFHP